tara:strand:- start:806 stop:1009 length:204 start_codon:yes stop_codon:yes gene_type:complete
MELIDTPNPNAKKVITDIKENQLSRDLYEVEGVSNVFFGPGFITITKEENTLWESINEDIINIFDRL